MKKIWLDKDFCLARLCFYLLLIIFYFYLIFINKTSCLYDNQCILCGLKTAVWETLKLNLIKAYYLNNLVVYIWIAMITMVTDILTIAILNLKNNIET